MMSNDSNQDEPPFVREIRRQVARSQNQHPTLLQGLMTFGSIGWMVALPAVGGALLGRWIDGEVAMKPFSWTLCLLLLGLALGCVSAWHTVNRGRNP
jgi:ATP synthase protein I